MALTVLLVHMVAAALLARCFRLADSSDDVGSSCVDRQADASSQYLEQIQLADNDGDAEQQRQLSEWLVTVTLSKLLYVKMVLV